MKFFLKLLFFLLIAGVVAFPVVFVFSSIENTPLVEQHQKISFENVKKVKALLHDSTPARMRKRQINKFNITEPDLDILLSYGVSQGLKFENIFTKIQLSDNVIKIFITAVLPGNPVGEYVNLSVSMRNCGTYLAVDTVKAGKMTLPGVLINPAIRMVDRYLIKSDIYDQLKENARAIKQIFIDDNNLKITYEWDPDALDKLHESGKTFLLTKEHQEKLILYYNALNDILQPYKGQRISLVSVLKPMFAFAAQQSEISSAPVLENTVVLQVLSLYVSQKGLKNFINTNSQKQVKPSVKTTIILYGRNDLPKHLLISAGLAVSAGSKLANLIGLAKEVGDSGRGSGFSFADLAADKAGVKMGELATASSEQALLFQNRVEAVIMEKEFMPAIDHLPEGIMELEFKKKYTDLDSDSYAMVNNEINKRINNCRVYR